MVSAVKFWGCVDWSPISLAVYPSGLTLCAPNLINPSHSFQGCSVPLPTPPEVVPHELLSHSQGSGCHPALPGVVPVFSAAATSPLFWISALNPSFAVSTASPEHQPAAPRTSSQCNPSLCMVLHPSASPLHPPHIVLHPSSALLHLAPEVPHSVWGDRAQLCPDNEICFSAGLLPQWPCCKESCR